MILQQNFSGSDSVICIGTTMILSGIPIKGVWPSHLIIKRKLTRGTSHVRGKMEQPDFSNSFITFYTGRAKQSCNMSDSPLYCINLWLKTTQMVFSLFMAFLYVEDRNQTKAKKRCLSIDVKSGLSNFWRANHIIVHSDKLPVCDEHTTSYYNWYSKTHSTRPPLYMTNTCVHL